MFTSSMRRVALGSLLLLGLSACARPATSPDTGAAPTATAQLAAPTTPSTTPTTVPALGSPSPEPAPPTSEPATPAPEPATPTTDSLPAPGAVLPADAPWVTIGSQVYAPGQAAPFDAVTEGDPAMVMGMVAAPDGSSLVYATMIEHRMRLVVRDLRTGGSRVVDAADADSFSRVSFSPDGTAIAFTSIGQERWRLIVMGIVSGEQHVIQEGSMMASADALPLPMVPVGWTEAGLFVERILYASDAPPRDLSLIDLASGEAMLVRADSHLQAIPAPDGASVVVIAGELPPGGQPSAAISRFDVATGSEVSLVPAQQALIRALRWSPDNAMIAYAAAATYESPETVVGVMNADGSNLRTIEAGRVRDLGWQDAATLLLLTATEQRRTMLQALPITTFDAAALQPVATFTAATEGAQPAQLLYVPR